MVGFPVLPICYVFALGIFAAFPSHSRALSEGSIGGLFYVNFMIDEFSYLNITSIGRNLIQDESDCGYACLEIPRCFSYNVAAFPDVNNKRLCELLPSDKYNNSDKFNTSKEFHHFFIPSSCDNSPCKSTGKCFPSYQENGDKCICVKGFTEKNCETNINDCDYSTCLNNGTCIDQINGFNCSCPSGFAGNRCEIDINECESSPCLNNGTCIDRKRGFNCSCPPGFSGTRCEIDINECSSNPCLNGGSCTDQVNGYDCSCQPGYAGAQCQTNINECSSNPCLNGGSCTDKINGYACSCQPGYAGTRCQSSVAIQWLHYTPQWCSGYRRYLKKPATLEQCKQACLSGCAAIEYWPVVRTCNECLDYTKRRPFTNTFDRVYPPHVYIKQ